MSSDINEVHLQHTFNNCFTMPSQYVPITENDSELTKIFLKHSLTIYIKTFLRMGPESVILPKYYLQYKDEIDNFEVREDDVWIVTFPKSGTTWTQEMAWCILHDLDFIDAQESLITRSPNILLSVHTDIPLRGLVQHLVPPYISDSVKYTAMKKSPRLIKIHLGLQLLPKQCIKKKAKIIYVARNPKDICISYFHFLKMIDGYTGSFEDFATLFLSDMITFAPYWTHVLDFWNIRHEPHILFLKYEDMKKDLPSVIRQTAAFLGKTLTDSQVRILAEHLSFARMKENPAVNQETAPSLPVHLLKNPNEHFMRKGEVGQWKTDMSPELIKRFDKWIKKHTDGTGLSF